MWRASQQNGLKSSAIAAGILAIDVNGKRVNEVTRIYPQHGNILLQCEGSEIFFRRVELRPLTGAAQ